MMVSGKLSVSEEELLRTKAFFLLKKWTSRAFLDNSIAIYRNFIENYQRNLDAPSSNQADLEKYYIYEFLPCLVNFERGLEMLSQGSDRVAAYREIIEGTRFADEIWGMAAEWHLIEYDPFFINMGRGGSRERLDGTPYTDPDSGIIRACGVLLDRLKILMCTLNIDFMSTLKAGKRPDGGDRVYTHWNFESMFGGATDAYGSLASISEVPADALLCPPKNESNVSQIFSGEKVAVNGIYEPWLPTGVVGCPNYLIEGKTAHEYRLEETDEILQARWRLIWEDRRYLNGNAPFEEVTYVFRSPWPAKPEKLGSFANQPCPKTGRWQAFRLKDRIEFVRQGDAFPGPGFTDTGRVFWQLLDEEG